MIEMEIKFQVAFKKSNHQIKGHLYHHSRIEEVMKRIREPAVLLRGIPLFRLQVVAAQ